MLIDAYIAWNEFMITCAKIAEKQASCQEQIYLIYKPPNRHYY